VGTIARKRKADPDAPHAIICGAGFGGLSAVEGLTKAGMRVTVLDGHLYSTFQPLLYQVATGGLNPGDVAYPVGGFVGRHGAVFRRGELAAIDPASRTIKLSDGRELGYDYLIIATGMSASYYGIPGAAENTFGLYTRSDAIALRDHLMAGLDRLSVDSGDLVVTVVGGGATGVELAGTLAELRRTVLRATFPDVDPSRVHVRLVEMAPSLLGPFHEKLREYARAQLAARDVDVRLDTSIREVTAKEVLLADGENLPSDITVWAAGVAATPAAAGWGLPQGKAGRIQVGPDLRVRGQDRIFAVGDIGVNPDDPTPQLAQPAIQMGRHAAAQIVRLSQAGGKSETEPFRYHDKGILATIGRRSAVVELARPKLRITGTLAWLAWFALHLVYLLGGRNRVSTLINLTYRYVAWGHGGGVIVGDEPAAPGQEAVRQLQ
jgi:NADH:ubiquinone reductase (H+-translocating)